MGLWAGLWIGTGLYWLIGIIVSAWFLAPIWPKFKDRGLAVLCVITCTFCVWFMWIIVYMSQMYPIPGVAPQVLWPENYICEQYPPLDYYGSNSTAECYHNPGP